MPARSHPTRPDRRPVVRRPPSATEPVRQTGRHEPHRSGIHAAVREALSTRGTRPWREPGKPAVWRLRFSRTASAHVDEQTQAWSARATRLGALGIIGSTDRSAISVMTLVVCGVHRVGLAGFVRMGGHAEVLRRRRRPPFDAAEVMHGQLSCELVTHRTAVVAARPRSRTSATSPRSWPRTWPARSRAQR